MHMMRLTWDANQEPVSDENSFQAVWSIRIVCLYDHQFLLSVLACFSKDSCGLQKLIASRLAKGSHGGEEEAVQMCSDSENNSYTDVENLYRPTFFQKCTENWPGNQYKIVRISRTNKGISKQFPSLLLTSYYRSSSRWPQAPTAPGSATAWSIRPSSCNRCSERRWVYPA